MNLSHPATINISLRIRPIAAILSIIALLLILISPAASYSQSDTRYFPETKHSIKGKFLQYWTDHGGLSQQGYPITEEFQEKNKLDGKTYIVQYFERSIFELHPENQAPFDVLLSQLGTFELNSRYPNNTNPAAAPISEPSSNAKTVSVNIIDYDFEPKSITIERRTTVTWTNAGQIIHTVADKDVTWSSDILNHGDTYSRVFDTPGTFTVICTIHPEMTSTVIVK